jgi:polyhydroxyalkanoate synthesis regulator phasin
VGHIAAQVRHLGVATARAMRATAAQVDDLERRVRALEEPDQPEGDA